MSARLRTFVLCSALVAFAAALLGAFSPAQVARTYLLALVALAGAVVASRTLSRFRRLERLPRKEVTEELKTPLFFKRAERRVELANASGVYFEQLRPRLREIAEQRLAAHGVQLRTSQARKLLGEETWLALDRPPSDRFAHRREGELARVIATLERI